MPAGMRTLSKYSAGIAALAYDSEQMRLYQGCMHCIVRDRLAGHRHARDIMGKVAATSRFNSRARPSTISGWTAPTVAAIPPGRR